MNMTIDTPTDSTSEMDDILRCGVGETLATRDFGNAFAQFFACFPELAPTLAAGIVAGGQRGFAFALFRDIWNLVPRPDHQWRPLTLPKPDRNGPCPCQSGSKFKQCCGWMEVEPTPFSSGRMSLLGYVLETIPVSQYATLPFKKLSAEEVAHVADEWLKDGSIGAAELLLEGLLSAGGKFDARHEYAFDTLCDLYLENGNKTARLALVERFVKLPDRQLKAAAMHRRCVMYADSGEYAAGWALFKEAQRIDPENPSLAHLELMMLASQGDLERAGERARFWAMSLRKRGYDHDPLLDLLDSVAADPHRLLDLMNGDGGAGGRAIDEAASADAVALLSMITSLPTAACHYRLEPQHGDAGPIQPMPGLAPLERHWHNIWSPIADAEEFDPWSDTAWIQWLQQHPLVWQSFPVIEDVLSSLLDSHSLPDALHDAVDDAEIRLLKHSVELLHSVIDGNDATNCSLAWGWLENRPALRLLAETIDALGDMPEALALTEWLVLTLNPTDNTGHRVTLVHRLCAAGRAADALAVCDRYPGDGLPAMVLGRVLTLVMLDKHDEAIAALTAAKKACPKMLKMLLAAKPKMPPMSAAYVTMGGDDDAWMYRTDWRYVWESRGALDWLKSMAGRK